MTTIASVEISGHTYTIRKLPLASARKVFARLQRVLALYADRDMAAEGLSPIVCANLAGALSEADLQFYATEFGPSTTVQWEDDRVLMLKDPKHQEEAFADNFADQLDWIDACVQLNFAGVLAKIDGAQNSKPASAPREAAGE